MNLVPEESLYFLQREDCQSSPVNHVNGMRVKVLVKSCTNKYLMLSVTYDVLLPPLPGADVVDWLHQRVDGFQDRREARKYAAQMLKAGYIRHTVNKKDFSEQCYYVFGDLCASKFCCIVMKSEYIPYFITSWDSVCPVLMLLSFSSLFKILLRKIKLRYAH